jgi:hypothetical protein
MSDYGQTASDFDDFEETLAQAEANAKSQWDMEFTGDLRDKYDQYGDGTYVSNRQWECLVNLAFHRKGYR